MAAQVYDHVKEVQAFLETKSGVKGIEDSGAPKIPRIFIHPPEELHQYPESTDHQLQIPLINMRGIVAGAPRREEVVREICHAAETWGFFQIVNHGVPPEVMAEALESVRRFHKQPTEAKKEFYSDDITRLVRIQSYHGHHQSAPADWRDSIMCMIPFDQNVNFEAFPPVCRDGIRDYMKHVLELKKTLCELLSEALGLDKNFLASIKCESPLGMFGHYHPPCPEPDLTLATAKHSDQTSLTILLQDSIGGLQILHQNQWVDVAPISEAFIINMGGIMQLITNDKFKSVEHRVVAKQFGPRISVAFFFSPSLLDGATLYGPIKELLSDDNPPKYKEVSYKEYMGIYRLKSSGGFSSPLPHLKL